MKTTTISLLLLLGLVGCSNIDTQEEYQEERAEAREEYNEELQEIEDEYQENQKEEAIDYVEESEEAEAVKDENKVDVTE